MKRKEVPRTRGERADTMRAEVSVDDNTDRGRTNRRIRETGEIVAGKYKGFNTCGDD